ncbi:efflux RND transporter periplasmic adaptor subunit [Pseudorhodoferax sp.]|uniref:efflux RND transporter periplasmic adaptor subunit n=1 Tax=Pseudorhodoferax sp. TaxID=1993553 RepID=UPI002DD673ED|nr:efflux RND transporter periplasmic adaptor subunit [Pseudorhodoferax sp.]
MNPTRISSRQRSALVATGSLALLAIAGWYGLDHRALAADPPATHAAPAVAATVATVQQQPMPLVRTGIGTVAATQSVTVKTRIDGQLDKIAFTEGQDVKAGQVLAHIDARALQAQLAQAQAAKAKDEASLANARADLARYTQLMRDDAATQQQLDTQKALVAQQQAAVQTDDAQIAYAQVQLSYTTITAPISGRTGARLVDVGNIVHATDTTGLVVINQVDPITVVFTLPEEAFQDVNRAINTSHQPLVVQALPRTGTEVLGTGKLTLLNNQIDTTNGTVQLKAQFPNPTHALWPGQYVNARLQLGIRPDALTIPAAAVQRGQNGTYVYRVEADGKTVQTQAIQVADIQDGVAVIAQGLAAGQQVVVDGQYKLKPGATITVAQAGAGK